MEQLDRSVDEVIVRNLRSEDLESVIALDARNVGRRREKYFQVKLQQNLTETGVKISLAAELDGQFCGFLLARVYYGEYGIMEPVAALDTYDVHPGFGRRGVGTALLRQLCVNLAALGVVRLQTEVDWANLPLLSFFNSEGFRPAARLCLELDPRELTQRAER